MPTSVATWSAPSACRCLECRLDFRRFRRKTTDFGSGKILPMRHNPMMKYTDIWTSRNSLKKPPKAGLSTVEGWLFSYDILG